ncbi:MAG: rhodanese-like domain-containing protein [Propionibacteriaceae bacterium]|jgi:rhodanese-related sulfurtransferase|nr:rhodanese-like domain-containing protein [Propionibacteriaceae bacterium]
MEVELSDRQGLMSRWRWLWLLLAGVLLLPMTACSTPSSNAALDPTGATIIDVRTPAEFADGHLEGADNIDFYAADFADQVGQLDHDARYIVYCKSGVRAGKAKAIMDGLGFKDVTSAGGFEEASAATGIPLVK